MNPRAARNQLRAEADAARRAVEHLEQRLAALELDIDQVQEDLARQRERLRQAEEGLSRVSGERSP